MRRRDEAHWSPRHAAYYPKSNGWVLPLAVGVGSGALSFLIGSTWGLTAQVLFILPVWALSAWSGRASVDREWDRWEKENPPRPFDQWVQEPPR